MEKVVFTYYGWFGICPVIFGNIRELPTGGFDERDIPRIHPRWDWLESWLRLSEWLICAYINFRLNTNVFYEPAYPILITGKLYKPVIRELPSLDE